MNHWLTLQQVQNNYEVAFGVTGIVTTGSVGTNTLVAKFIHGGDFIGIISSFYLNNADLNGF